jgi:hypothetical protein
MKQAKARPDKTLIYRNNFKFKLINSESFKLMFAHVPR